MPKIALVLSAGAARGAYEAGVFAAMVERFTAAHGRAPRITYLVGTSIGGLQCPLLAGEAATPDLGVAKLLALWKGISPDQAFSVGFHTLMGLPRLILGGGKKPHGVVSTAPLAALVEQSTNWGAIRANIATGCVGALAVGAIHIRSGRSTFFVETADENMSFAAMNDEAAFKGYCFEPATLRADHCLATGAIPLAFPPVNIDGDYYMDGGSRAMDPYDVAVSMGATHVFGIGTVKQAADGALRAGAFGEGPPSALSVMGLVLNSYFDAQRDLAVLQARGAQGIYIAPSQSLGALAARYLASGEGGKSELLFSRIAYAFLSPRGGSEGEVASNMLFEPGYARTLIALGRRDLEDRWTEVHAFLIDGGA